MTEVKFFKYRDNARPIDGVADVVISQAKNEPGIVWLGGTTFCLVVCPGGAFECHGQGFGGVSVDVVSISGDGGVRWTEWREDGAIADVALALDIVLLKKGN